MLAPYFPTLQHLPKSLPLNGAVELELVEGALIFRASEQVQSRIESLLDKAKNIGLTTIEEEELNCYEEMDDYLSFVNRTICNAISIINSAVKK
ncbi:MAG: hypothetical protein GC158_15740 [Cyanobacteria bacterium RI_101]|nr:hypothetical protein [Cyanobacteria bacterium RI_101]